jgi:copper chaperone CopZ
MTNTLTIKIKGMDCSSCVIDIDGVLEDTDGVEEARTNFAKEQTSVMFNPAKVKPEKLVGIIAEIGYEAVIVDQKH